MSELDPASYDDRLDEIVSSAMEAYEKAFTEYHEEFLHKKANRHEKRRLPEEKRIKRSQLAALVGAAESLGARGFVKLVGQRSDRNRKNLQAYRDGKGGTPPKNASFWKVMRGAIDGDLDALANELGDRDAVFASFAHRLAVEWNYRETVGTRRKT